MKKFFIVLIIALLFLQYKLWFAKGNITDAWRLKHNVDTQVAKNILTRERNAALEAEVKQLKQGSHAAEERARRDLGMVKKDEKYYQIIDKKKNQSN